MKEIRVKTSLSDGIIYIGEEVLTTRLPQLLKGQKNFLVTDSNVFSIYEKEIGEWFQNCKVFIIPAGEENKNFQTLHSILEEMIGAGLHRTSRLFILGGGVVGDIAGLAAALYMRGISCVQIPTSLLAQVDSSVGGKTAVDFGGVKNIVGAFYQPQEVLIDPNFLKTLPKREIKCGVGEIIKYAALSEEIYTLLQANTEKLEDLAFLTTLIEACVRHKAEVVELDERETGERKSLNVGHTTGHAIELTSNRSHGECVLYGMFLETVLAMEAGVCEREYGNSLLEIIKKGLALEPNDKLDLSNIEKDAEKAKSDKKNKDDGSIQMAVAKCKGEWTMLSMPFSEYASGLKKAVEKL